MRRTRAHLGVDGIEIARTEAAREGAMQPLAPLRVPDLLLVERQRHGEGGRARRGGRGVHGRRRLFLQSGPDVDIVIAFRVPVAHRRRSRPLAPGWREHRLGPGPRALVREHVARAAALVRAASAAVIVSHIRLTACL